MKFEYTHPKDQILQVMNRIYRYGMTTTSGGNVSLRDADGAIWITPAGVDKGSLVWDDIVRVDADGTVTGRCRPSSELPFHQAIYRARPDLKAIVHAHPTALVAYSIARKLPPTRIIPQAFHLCSRVGFAPYALPGSAALGDSVAASFAEGNESVVLENHGVVCGGVDLFEAFSRFETLEYCARLAITAGRVGTVVELSEEQVALREHRRHFLPERAPGERSSREKELRRAVADLMRRAYEHQLVSCLEGIASVRLEGDSFLITPTGMDRYTLDPSDIVLIEGGKRETGRLPSRSVCLHQQIYRDHPWVGAVVSAQPPASLSFCVTGQRFATRTIPESYIVLRDLARVPFGAQYTDESSVSGTLSADQPVALIENEAILVVGKSLLEAYDRLEVAEFTAKSIIDASVVGEVVEMDDAVIEELERAFLGK